MLVKNVPQPKKVFHLRFRPVRISIVYHIDLKEENIITEVPKNVRSLDEKLGLNIFPKKQS